MKCKECLEQAKSGLKKDVEEARWLVIDQIPYEELFLPLCDEHFQQLKEMEGEVNLEFEHIEGLTLDDVVRIANEKWQYLNKKYVELLSRGEH